MASWANMAGSSSKATRPHIGTQSKFIKSGQNYVSKTPPKLVVFDLDFTVWQFYIDNVKMSGTKKSQSTRAKYGKKFTTDYSSVSETEMMRIRNSKEYQIFPEIFKVFDDLTKRGITMAVASRAGDTNKGKKLLEIFGLMDYFLPELVFIHSGTKTKHFQEIMANFKNSKKQKITHQEILFFDDQNDNLQDLGPLGVTCFNVDINGCTLKNLNLALEKFDDNRQNEVEYPDNCVWRETVLRDCLNLCEHRAAGVTPYYPSGLKDMSWRNLGNK